MLAKLYDFHEGAIHFVVPFTSPSGKGQSNAYVTFEPDVVYKTEDPIIQMWFRGEVPGAIANPILSSDLREALSYFNIKYKVNSCGTCSGGKNTHIEYNPFEIIED